MTEEEPYVLGIINIMNTLRNENNSLKSSHTTKKDEGNQSRCTGNNNLFSKHSPKSVSNHQSPLGSSDHRSSHFGFQRNEHDDERYSHRQQTSFDSNPDIPSQKKVSSRSPRRERKLEIRPQEKKVKFVLANKSPKVMKDSESSSDENIKYIPVGYKYLQEWSNKETHEIVVEILNTNSKFEVFLNESELPPDILFLVIKILANLCTSVFVDSKGDMLNKISRSKLIHSISFYLGVIQTETDTKTIANLKTFIDDLTVLLESITFILRKIAYEKDLKKVVMKTIKAVEEVNVTFNSGVKEATIKKLNTLMKILDDYQNVLKEEAILEEHSQPSELNPPNDFRSMSLYPTYDDLTRLAFNFLRPNKEKGIYFDVEHYLDVQFRLLREDYIDPLRVGLRKYAEAREASSLGKRLKNKFESVRLYPRTKFECQEVTKTNNIGYVLNFDPEYKIKIKWEYTNRFNFGSLLLFTTDDFQTFFYGTVLKRDVERLKSGTVLVSLTDNFKIDDDFYDKEFLMAESEVLFEPYFLVMKRLVKLDENKFPMAGYIVHGKCETRMPAYLKNFKIWNILGFQLRPMQTYNWPTAHALGMDESQYQAFKTALTSDFTVIQGPPGTGKSFLGLKIVEVLLKNIRWNKGAVRTPILVVCYTNHALDQFLEGVLKYTTKIVRAGSRSKSQILSNYNLRGQYNASKRREVKTVGKAITDIKNQNEQNVMKIRTLIGFLNEIDCPAGILKVTLLSKQMSEVEKQFFKNDDILLEWLLMGKEKQHLLPVESCSDSELTVVDLWEVNATNIKSTKQHDEANEDLENDVNDDTGLIDETSEETLNQTLGSCYYKTVDGMRKELQDCLAEMRNMKQLQKNCRSKQDYNDLRNEIREMYKTLKKKYDECNTLGQKLKSDIQLWPENTKITQMKRLRQLSLDDRWRLYWLWVVGVRRDIVRTLNVEEQNYRQKLGQYDEYQQIRDIHVVSEADVVGMTTTCAARLHIVMEQVKPAIVIVEEAAEVLEPHVVTSLTNSCQQVILIGDHKQLKPKISAYQLGRKYKFDISLFERMINNGMYCPKLNIQHRMRPEISSLITPLIYPDLRDHKSVTKYSPVRGVCKSVFFLEHNTLEEEVNDSSSRKNVFEMEFLVELCKYLLMQGYSASDITILTTYTGQMYLFREKNRESNLLRNVKCVVVDKYQGEENKIILLSLVRSNKEGKIGFLKMENRICVALSRAKEGLYIVGNMDILSASSPVWKEIETILRRQEAIGKAMKLYCEKHDNYTDVSEGIDFNKVSEGGCDLPCHQLMSCGHKCESVCHSLDREHKKMKCYKKCDSCRPTVQTRGVKRYKIIRKNNKIKMYENCTLQSKNSLTMSRRDITNDTERNTRHR